MIKPLKIFMHFGADCAKKKLLLSYTTKTQKYLQRTILEQKELACLAMSHFQTITVEQTSL